MPHDQPHSNNRLGLSRSSARATPSRASRSRPRTICMLSVNSATIEWSGRPSWLSRRTNSRPSSVSRLTGFIVKLRSSPVSDAVSRSRTFGTNRSTRFTQSPCAPRSRYWNRKPSTDRHRLMDVA